MSAYRVSSPPKLRHLGPSQALIEEARRRMVDQGVNVSQWARDRGFSPRLVHSVLAGKRKCIRGECHDISVALGLKAGTIEESRDD